MLHRKKLVLEFWDRSRELGTCNLNYRKFISRFFGLLLKSDVKNGDITTNSVIGRNKKIKAWIVAKEDGTVAGIEEFLFLNKDLKLKIFKKDSNKIKKDEILIEIDGNAAKILQRERINLNFLQRMGGIATLTDKLNKKLKNVKIAATRKTLWGPLDKKAVSVGGGLTHRLDLSDGVLIKENHLKMIKYNFEMAINHVKDMSRYIEVEVESMSHAMSAAGAIKKMAKKGSHNLFAIMLDKVNPAEIKSIVEDFKRKGVYDKILLEASGNINPDNLSRYAGCGVDIVSMGSMTNSAKVLDMSQDIK